MRASHTITGWLSRACLWLVPLLSGSARAQFGDPNNSLLMAETIKVQGPLCMDRSEPAEKRIASCTTLIKLGLTQKAEVAKLHVARAQALQDSGDEQAALQDLDAAVNSDPKGKVPWIGRGDFYFKKSDYPHALESYDHALQIGGRDPQSDLLIYENRGSALESLGRHEEAIADFTRAIALDPQDTIAYSNRATVLLRSNRLALAIADLSEVIRLEPADGRAFYERGTAYERSGALEKALNDYREAVRLRPGFAPAAAALGRLLAARNPGEALENLSAAIRLDPRSAALRTRANLYLSLGQPERALADFDQVIANDGADGIAFLDRGVAKAKLGDFTGAVADYTRSLALAPSVTVYLDRGDAYLHLQREDDARADFDAALQREPQNVLALLGRANADYAGKRLEASLSDYTQVIEADPSNALAYFKRGNVHLDRGELAAAYEDYSASLKLEPNESVVLFNRALAAQRLRRFAEAAKDRKRAQELGASQRTAATGPVAPESTSTPTQVSMAPTEVTFAAPRTPAAPTSGAAASAASAQIGSTPPQQITINGYRRTVVNGQERFCRSEKMLGSHIQMKEVCLTRAQVQAEQESTQRFIENVQRTGGVTGTNPAIIGGAVGH